MADRPRLKSPLDKPPAPPPPAPPTAPAAPVFRAPEMPPAAPRAWELPPWIAVCLAPRAALRGELSHGSQTSLTVLAVLAGVAGALLVAATSGQPAPVGAWLLLAATLGSVMGILIINLYGALVHRSGLWLGGVAEIKEARAAVAWGFVPIIGLLPVHLVWLLSQRSWGQSAPAIALVHTWLTLTVGVATMLLLAACVAEAHRFSNLKGLAALWLAPLAIVVLPFPARPESRPRFSMRTLLVLSTVVAVACAAFPGVTRGGGDREFYLVFLLVAPLAALLVLGIVHQALRRRR